MNSKPFIFLNMKSPFTLILVVTTLLAGLPLTYADNHEKTELGYKMTDLNRSWRLIKRQARSADKNASTIELVEKSIAVAKESKPMNPDLLSDIPEAKKDEFLKGYQKEMDALVVHLGKLKALLEAGDNSAANQLIREIDGHRRDSHKAYKRPDE